MVLVEELASLGGPGMAGLQVACGQEKGACKVAGAQVNVAPEEASVVTFGPFEKMGDTAADLLRHTCLSSQVEAGREEGRSQDPVEGSLRSGLVVQ